MGIGATNPSNRLHVEGDYPQLRLKYITGSNYALIGSGTNALVFSVGTGTEAMTILHSSGNVGIGTTGPSQKLHVVGNICATGTIAACSDLRYKTDITPLSDALSNLLSLQGVTYRWRVGEFPEMNFVDEPQIGLIAQEVEQLYPEIVQMDKDGYKSIDYARLTPVLIEGMKELNAHNERLETRLTELETLLQSLLTVRKDDQKGKSLGDNR